MKVTKCVETEVEVDVYISSSDISLILMESNDIKFVERGLNEIAQFMKGIPDSIIQQLDPEQRKAVRDFFQKTIGRFEEPDI